MKHGFSLWLFLLAALVGRSARADEAPDVERSKELFDEGRRLASNGDCKAATKRFLESLRYNESIGARLNLAGCYEHDEPLLAWRQLHEAERLATTLTESRIAYAREHARVLEPRVAMIRIHFAERPEGVDVRVDGAPLTRFDYDDERAFALDPIAHTIDVVAVGRAPWSVVVTPTIGTVTTVAPTLVPRREGSVASPSTKRGSTQRTLGVVAGGAGVVGLGVGAVFGVIAQSNLNDAKAACGTYPNCTTSSASTVDPAYRSADRAATLSTIGIVAGVALLATGAILYLTAPKSAATHAAAALRGAW